MVAQAPAGRRRACRLLVKSDTAGGQRSAAARHQVYSISMFIHSFGLGPNGPESPPHANGVVEGAEQGQGASSGGRWSRRPLSHAIARRSKLSVHTPSPPPRCRPAFARGAERERERGRGGWGRERERETFLGAKVQRPGDRPCIPYERSVYVSMWAGRTEGASLSAPAGGRTARALSLSLSRSLALFCSLALSRLRLLSVSRCRQHGLLPRQLISLPLSLHLPPERR